MVATLLITTSSPKVKPPKAACLTTEFLRIKLGDHEYAFPRKFVRSLYGKDVRNILDARSESAGGDNVCQSEEDSVLDVKIAVIDFRPKVCGSDIECRKREFSIHLFISKAAYEHHEYRGNTSKEELLKECAPRGNPRPNHYDPKYWAICDFVFKRDDLYADITFPGDIYPPQDIEKTQSMIWDYLEQYKTNNE